MNECFPFCELVKAIIAIPKELRGLKYRLYLPGTVRMRLVRQGENGMLYFVFQLPAVGASDVIQRELTVTIASGDPVVVNPAVGDFQSAEFAGNDNDDIHAELVDIDDAGNRSQPSVFDGVLVDTLPPPQPGELGITITREE